MSLLGSPQNNILLTHQRLKTPVLRFGVTSLSQLFVFFATNPSLRLGPVRCERTAVLVAVALPLVAYSLRTNDLSRVWAFSGHQTAKRFLYRWTRAVLLPLSAVPGAWEPRVPSYTCCMKEVNSTVAFLAQTLGGEGPSLACFSGRRPFCGHAGRQVVPGPARCDAGHFGRDAGKGRTTTRSRRTRGRNS